jgi:hypothetical protein
MGSTAPLSTGRGIDADTSAWWSCARPVLSSVHMTRKVPLRHGRLWPDDGVPAAAPSCRRRRQPSAVVVDVDVLVLLVVLVVVLVVGAVVVVVG